jgi:hypothetical protein
VGGKGEMLTQVERISKKTIVCTENLIRVEDVMESPKLAE